MKASIAVTHRRGLIIGARTFPGNPYDGHILSAQLEQTNILLEDVGRTPKQVVVDLGYCGVDADNPGVEIIHRGRFKSMTNQQRRWLKHRQAIEPAIGHLKADHRMNRCWLAGSLGDALHTVLCAAGYNLRWLLRAVVRGRIKRFFSNFGRQRRSCFDRRLRRAYRSAEYVSSALQQLAPPFSDLIRMQIVPLRDLGHRLLALERLQGHLGLECR